MHLVLGHLKAEKIETDGAFEQQPIGPTRDSNRSSGGYSAVSNQRGRFLQRRNLRIDRRRGVA